MVEIDCPVEHESRLIGDYPHPLQRLHSGGRLLLFVEDARPLLEWLQGREGWEEHSLVVRPSNLEDVFLDATGTSLETNP